MCVDRRLGRAEQQMIWSGYCYDAVMAIHMASTGIKLAQDDPDRLRLLQGLEEFFNYLSQEVEDVGYMPAGAGPKSMSSGVIQTGRDAFYRTAALVRPAQAEVAVAKEVRDLLRALLSDQPLTREQQAFGLEFFGQLQLDISRPYIAVL